MKWIKMKSADQGDVGEKYGESGQDCKRKRKSALLLSADHFFASKVNSQKERSERDQKKERDMKESLAREYGYVFSLIVRCS